MKSSTAGFRSDRITPRSGRRLGLAAMEVVMIIGAILPIAVLLFRYLIQAMVLYHWLIGNTVGSPLL